jgi:hypothetical protein
MDGEYVTVHYHFVDKASDEACDLFGFSIGRQAFGLPQSGEVAPLIDNNYSQD